MGLRASFRLRPALCAAAYVALSPIAPSAMAGGPPVVLGTQTGIEDGRSGIVLDTRTGIHDGRSGVVLQNAPLSPAPMVPAQQLPTLEQTGSVSGQPTIVVEPSLSLPGAPPPTSPGNWAVPGRQ